MGTLRVSPRQGAAFGLWLLSGIVLRDFLEESMVRHVLVQLPSLAGVGLLLMPHSAKKRPTPFAIPVFLLAAFTTAIWMLPRTLDAALASDVVAIAKLTTIPFFIGIPLAWSWSGLSDLARSFVWANLISMFIALGWLYHAAPIRLCNYYLRNEQEELGTAFLAIGAAIVAFWLPRLFIVDARRPLTLRQAATPHPLHARASARSPEPKRTSRRDS